MDNTKAKFEEFTPEQLTAAKVPFTLACWYLTVAKNLTRLNVLDELRISTVRQQVHEHSRADALCLEPA